MARSDYAHWNEEQDLVWWQEEGRHIEEPPFQDDDELFGHRDAEDAAHEDFYEKCQDTDLDELRSMRDSGQYTGLWLTSITDVIADKEYDEKGE